MGEGRQRGVQLKSGRRGGRFSCHLSRSRSMNLSSRSAGATLAGVTAVAMICTADGIAPYDADALSDR